LQRTLFPLLKLHASSNADKCQVPWKLTLRKEVFLPGETLDNPTVVDLVFHQLVADALASSAHPKLTSNEQQSLLDDVKVRKLDKDVDSAESAVKLDIVKHGRTFKRYFGRQYKVRGMEH
jgi:myosin-15